MIREIKESYTYNIFKSFTSILDNLISSLHNKIYKKENNSRENLSCSYIYKFFSYIEKMYKKFQNFLYFQGKKSYIFGEIDIFRDILQKLDILFILIPVNYLFIDYIMRNVSFLLPISTVWDELILVMMYIYVLFRGLLFKPDSKNSIILPDIIVTLFILVGGGLLLFVSPDIRVAIEGFRAVYQHIFWYFPMRIILNKNNRIYALRSLSITGFFLGYHSLYQFIRKVPMPGNWVDSTETITTRAFSIIGSPNILGAMFVILIPLVIGMIYYEKNKVFKIISIISVFPMFIGLLVTFARQAYLAIFGAFFIFFILFYPKIIKYLIVFVGIIMLIFPTVSNRILYLFSPTYFIKSSKGGRLRRYVYAIEEWKKAPFLGNGLGRFGGAVATNHNLTPFYVDSYYLKTLGEMGIVGIVAMFFTFISILKYSKRVLTIQKDKKDMFMVALLFIGILGILLQNIVENVFEVPMMIAIFWTIVAILLTFDNIQNMEK